jgi:DNA invertase Pin-like site-specific DNA recombinase
LIFIDRQFIDTTTPTGKLMFQIVGAFAELERGMIRERVHAGLKRAVATLPPLNAPVPSLVREQAS